VGEGATGAIGSGCSSHLASRETVRRGTNGVHGTTGQNNPFKFSKKEWWRRGSRNIQAYRKHVSYRKFETPKNAEYGKIALNWNVSGTQDFSIAGFFVG
jgi:hypothetical protein